ncbi:MAG: CoA transferase [Betaproteobacteria bacterium]|nr:MAG: CoA transferase [Betaproteobacteria bacterium]
MTQPLDGVRIIDLTTVVMGPFATQLLGDLGADIIKIEPPDGDILRHIAPMRHPAMGHIFLHHNRNKRSLVLDLKKPAGYAALQKLLQTADVLIYNVRPQAMQRLRLSYDEVAAVNPRIIYVGAYGFGQRGPYAAQPAYDDLIQGMSALPALFHEAGASSPRYAPLAIADRITGLAAVNAVTTALFARCRTGEGQAVEVPMFETMAQMVLADHMGGHTFQPPEGPHGYARMLAPHRAPYETRDGYMCVLIYNDKHWRAFFRLIGREDMFDTDPRFGSHEARSRNIAEVYAFAAEQLKQRTTAEWEKLLREADIPAAPMKTVADLLNDPHLAQTGFFMETEHPSEGRLREMTLASHWSGADPMPHRPAPRLGEHSAEILREAGYADADIERLAAEGVTKLA